VRAGLADDGTRIRVLRRAGDTGWETPPGLDDLWDRLRPAGLGGDGKTLSVTVPAESGRWALHSYDLAADRLGELLLAHDYYDINPVLLQAPRDRALLGARWWAEKERTFWFHAELAAVQQALDKALPGTTNSITSLSDDLQRMVVLAWSARNPGVYFQFDRAKVELKPLFAVRPWVQPPQMAESFAASYKARDGLVIHGYLTVPTGREAKGLPLVVWPGSEPWSRVTWGHDPTVQFLANRGYAVLQVNPRGSAGYGRAFHEAGRRRIGSVIPADIVDGAKWAIEQGIADPRRLAIGGIGFGGGAALLATVRAPELFRAAVAIDAVTDWPAQLAHLAQLDPVGAPRVRLLYGDPAADAAELAAASAVNHAGRIGAPVLLVNGNVETVPRVAARAFAAALKQAGRPHEVLARFDAVEGLNTPRGYAELLERLDEFLGKHLGGGAERR
jgi:dipeptidyl aminopeptidase/acylaminoacyl peptidase